MVPLGVTSKWCHSESPQNGVTRSHLKKVPLGVTSKWCHSESSLLLRCVFASLALSSLHCLLLCSQLSSALCLATLAALTTPGDTGAYDDPWRPWRL